MVPPYMIPAPASRVGVASIYAGKYTIKFDENGGGSRKGPYLLMSLMDGPEGRREVQCALVHANSRDSATGPTNLNLNGFVGARAEQSSTFLAASPPPSRHLLRSKSNSDSVPTGKLQWAASGCSLTRILF